MPDFKLGYRSILEKQYDIDLKSQAYMNGIVDPYISTCSYRHCLQTKRPNIWKKWCWSNWIIAHLEEWDWILLSMQDRLCSREDPTPWWATQTGLESFFLKEAEFFCLGLTLAFGGTGWGVEEDPNTL